MYLEAVTTRFGPRLLFVGVQGSYGRGEATETSDIDMVLILDTVSAHDLRAYDEAISGLPHRNKICGFVSGKQELFCWSKADLFQFYHDTVPLSGDLRSLLPEIGENDVRHAILTGACNIYHLCAHNSVHEKDPEILKALYKTAVFVVQALHYHRTGDYLKTRCELLPEVPPQERRILSAYSQLKAPNAGPCLEFDALSESLFNWSGRIVREYGKTQP